MTNLGGKSSCKKSGGASLFSKCITSWDILSKNLVNYKTYLTMEKI